MRLLPGGDRRLLFRSYLFVVTGLIFVAIVLDLGFGYLQSSQERPDERWLATTFDLIERELAGLPPPERGQRATRLGDDLGIGVRLLRKDDVVADTDSNQEILSVVDAQGNASYLHEARSIDAIVRLGPIEEPKQSALLRLLPPIFYLSIFVVVGLWLRPLLTDINRISEGARRFAADYREPINTRDNVSELKVLAGHLDVMSSKLSGLIQSQKELIAALSHEMRTPLARIRFALAVIGDDADTKLQTQLVAIGDDVQEIDQLIASMLNYARLDHPDLSMHWQDVPVASWVAQIMEKCRSGDKPVTLVDDIALEKAWMDPRLMELALSNLLVNACRYARGQVRCSVARHDDDYSITVEDDGQGIPEDEREGVFKAFARLDDSRNRQTGGYGLGLAIVARIAALHGGSVRVGESRELGGARFELNWSGQRQR